VTNGIPLTAKLYNETVLGSANKIAATFIGSSIFSHPNLPPTPDLTAVIDIAATWLTMAMAVYEWL